MECVCLFAELQASQYDDDTVNLDGWLLTQNTLVQCVSKHSAGCDVSVIDGCLGIFDSIDGSEQGSTAQISKWLSVPMVLVVDAQAFSCARSIAALLQGYSSVDATVSIAGIILNRVSSKEHGAELKTGLHGAGITMPVLGCLPKV